MMLHSNRSRLLSLAIVIALSVAGAPRAARAQRTDTSTTLRPVVVTATRIPTKLADVTQPVTVLNGAALRARGVLTVAEALRLVPGATVAQSGSYGAVTSLFLRGGESRYTKVLIDGVPVNAVGGAFYFQNLTLVNVDRIEVVEGPASALYGADAMTGVIQIFTRDGRGPAGFDLAVRGGSYGTREIYGSMHGGREVASYSLGGEWNQTDGVIPFNNQYSTGTLSGAVLLAPDRLTKLTLTSRYSASVYHFPTDFSGVPNDTNSYTREHRLVLGMNASRVVSPSIVLRLLAGDNELHNLSEDTQPQPDSTSGFVKTSSPSAGYRRRVEGRVEAVTTPAATVALGGVYEAERERASTITVPYVTSPNDGTGTTVPGGNDRRTTEGLYAAAQGTVAPGLAYDASVRFDRHSDFRNVTTYHTGAVARLWQGARVRASYGTGFNAPAFYQTQGSAYNRPNSVLQPEQTRTFDVALEQSFLSERLRASVGVFDQRFSQLIQYVGGQTSGPPDYTQLTPAYYDNLTEARARGYEARATFVPTSAWSASVSYTQLLATVYSVAPAFGGSLRPGDALLRRPSHSGTALLAYTAPTGWNASASANYVGKRPDMDFAVYPSPTVSLQSYVKLDLAASLPLFQKNGSDVAITVRVNNALDRKYQDVLHFPAPRRAFLLGGRLGVAM